MAKKKRVRLTPELLDTLSKDRQRRLLFFRATIVEAIGDLVQTLHLLQPLLTEEEFMLQLASDCGFTGTLRITVDDYGTCPRSEAEEAIISQAEDLVLKRLVESKGTLMHNLGPNTTMAEARERIAQVKEGAKKKKKPRRSAKASPAKTDVDVEEIQRMIDAAANASSKKPHAPDIQKDYGFLN